ncbi:MAG: TonB-dependent receptor [Sphingomonadales bacterium]|nr:TonB-dependent receptor [Sphingomonadales bacterium]MDE2170121.1 TonB-dependent receptor [Sphingomonadales bacterium]
MSVLHRTPLAIRFAATLSATALTLSLAATSHAQAAAAQDTKPAAPAADAQPADQEIVVTGNASGIRKLEAGYSVTTISANDIAIANPKSTGDLLKTVPGIWVESSGGVGTSNVFVRGIPSTGDAPFLTMQFDGIPVFGTNSPSFMDQTALVRIDDTIQSVEGVNGGPASLFSDGQPGLTTNLMLREGHEATEGSIKVSTTTYAARRVDGYLSGKLAEDTYYMIGGYYASGDTVRNAGFDTEKGGQITVNLTHKFSSGKINVFARYTDDHGEWFLPFATNVPGINQGTYNQLNNNTRYLTIVTPGTGPNGPTEQFDMGSGRGWKGVIAGGNLNVNLAPGLDLVDKFGYTNGTLQTTGLVPAGAGAITVASALAAGDGTAGQTTVQTIHTGQTLAANDYVQQFGAWVIEKQLNSVTNDGALTWSADRNKLTGGYYFSHFSSNDLWSLGNNYWMQVGGSSPDLVNLNNSGATTGGFNIADFGSADLNAVYLADSYNITEALRLDAGIRWENQTIHFTIRNDGTAGSSRNVSRNALPWTVGLNYRTTRNLDAYVRVSQGYHMPSFDDVRSQIGNTGPALDDKWKVFSTEVGLKYHQRGLDLSLAGFYDKVTGAVYNDVGVPPQVAGSKTWGLEFDGSWTSDFGLSITTNDVIENPKTNSPGDSFNNLQAVRIPKYQARITPAYKVTVNDNTSASLYATFEALGKRYSDLNNLQPLGAYQTLSAGILVEHNGINFQVAVDNITNSHGLTEGNPRFLNTPGAALPVNRPIFGRSAKFTVGYKF